MNAIVLKILSNLLGYLGAKLLKPEAVVELILDLVDNYVKRTDSPGDDQVAKDVRKALGHEEKKD